jgi:cytochrome c oxidase subunit 2
MELLKYLKRRCDWVVVSLLLLGFSPTALAGLKDQVPIETGYMMPRDVSRDGHRVEWLINITMVFLIILFVVMVVWMAVAIFKHNENHQAAYDHGDAKKQIAVALSISTFIFLVVDGNLYVNAMVDLDEVFWNFKDVENDPTTVKIEINAHQWAWDARYAGPDGEFNTADDIVTLNDIRIPLDRPVYVQLASSDVIHSFNLVNFRIKQDAVPGNITPIWFQAIETGVFEISCSEHCGAFHYKMGGLLTVLENDAYEVWAAEASAKSAIAYNVEDVDAKWGWPWRKEF